MRRENRPFNKRRYVIDKNPLAKEIHDLDSEKKACNIHKIMETKVTMMDTESQVNKFIMIHDDYTFCRACMEYKHDRLDEIQNREE